MRLFNNFIHSVLFRYLLVGGTAYFFELSMLFLLKHLGLSNLYAVAISFWLGLLFAFFTQKIFSFRNHHKDRASYLRQFSQYILLVIFNYAFTLVFVSKTSEQITVYAARTITVCIITIWNFFIYKTLIFNNQPKTRNNRPSID